MQHTGREWRKEVPAAVSDGSGRWPGQVGHPLPCAAIDLLHPRIAELLEQIQSIEWRLLHSCTSSLRIPEYGTNKVSLGEDVQSVFTTSQAAMYEILAYLRLFL